MTCCNLQPICYKDISPCDVVPVQTPGSTVKRFDTAEFIPHDNTRFRGVTAGGIACGNVELSAQQGADRLINNNYGGTGLGPVIFYPVAPRIDQFTFDVETNLEFAVPIDNVTSVRLFTGYGGVLNDFDGIGGHAGHNTIMTVYNAVDVILDQRALFLANSGNALAQVFSTPLDGVKRVHFDRWYSWSNQPDRCPGIREIDATGDWESDISWTCGGTKFTAHVRGTAAGFTVADGNFTNVGGEHSLTFSSSTGQDFTAEITTNNPGVFSALEATPQDPTITVQDGTGTFSVRFILESDTRRGYVDLSAEPPEFYDIITGERMAVGGFTPISCEDFT